LIFAWETKERANRFVVDAFNGRVDAILSRTKHDNYGTLDQEIRDAFNIVNCLLDVRGYLLASFAGSLTA
jgi:hypothetical protein